MCSFVKNFKNSYVLSLINPWIKSIVTVINGSHPDAMGGKTAKTEVLPGFCEKERGGRCGGRCGGTPAIWPP